MRRWCNNETTDAYSEHAQQLYDYLNAYKKKYNYDIVFFVSNKTYNYYYDRGLNKVISRSNDFDVWYFNFLKLNQEYDIQIDHDEVNNYSVTLFVNCIVKDFNGKTVGVVGVGKKIDNFESSVRKIIDLFDVDVSIVNIGNAHNSFTGSSGFYKTSKDAADEMGLTESEVLSDVGSEGFVWVDGNKITAVQKNGDLNWNIFVQKDTSDTIQSMLEQTYTRNVFLTIIIVLYILASFMFLHKLKGIDLIAENTDEFTGLYNNKLFKDRYYKRSKRQKKGIKRSMFILDVDNFKTFNDTYGHLYGNTVLKIMADELKDNIGNNGEVCRWGGDEFVGEIFGTEKDALRILEGILEKLKDKDTKMTITFSCGIAAVSSKQSLEENLKKADKALYRSKEKGKNCCTLYTDL